MQWFTRRQGSGGGLGTARRVVVIGLDGVPEVVPGDDVARLAIEAAAAELVMGKVRRCPFAIIRGYAYERREGAAAELVMDAASDLFR